MDFIIRWTLLLATVFILQDFLVPVVLAALFSLSLAPLFEKLLVYIPKPKLVATALLTSIVVGFLLPLVFLVLTGLSEAKILVSSKDLVTYQSQVLGLFESFKLSMATKMQGIGLNYDVQKVLEYTSLPLKSFASWSFKSVETALKSLPWFFLSAFVFVVSLYGFLLGRHKVKDAVLSLWPQKHHPEVIVLLDSISKVSRAVVSAAILAGLLQSMTVFIFGWIGSAPYLLLFCLLTFLLSFVPVLGTLPVTLVLLSLSYFQENWTIFVMYLAMAAILSSIDNLLRPLIIGHNTSLAPTLAFLSAIGGLATLGFIGLFLGPIIVAVFLSSLKRKHS